MYPSCDEDAKRLREPRNRVPALVAAHRGAHGPGRPANSAAALEHAVAIGAPMAEIDVRRTRDGALALVHDAEVAGAAVGALTLEQLGERLGHEALTLAGALRQARGRLGLNVELKENGSVEEAIDALRALWDAPGDGARAGAGSHDAGPGTLLVTSFLDAVVAQVAQRAPPLPVGLLVEEQAEGAIQRARACGAATLSMSLALADGGLLSAAHDAGLHCVVWDVDADADLRRLLHDPRVGVVITDHPQAALAIAADAALPG
jgi:glycerophosphoryl diester phosphodiesterase